MILELLFKLFYSVRPSVISLVIENFESYSLSDQISFLSTLVIVGILLPFSCLCIRMFGSTKAYKLAQKSYNEDHIETDTVEDKKEEEPSSESKSIVENESKEEPSSNIIEVKSMEGLKEYLLSRFPDARLASNGREVCIRCRFCGDSQRDKTARHLYIKVDGDTPFYNCFKCNTSGVLTSELLKSWLPTYDENDTSAFLYLDETLKKAKASNYNKRSSNLVYMLNNTLISDTELSNAKLNYINTRLGLHLTYDDMIENKIVLNLGDVLECNHIKEYTRSRKDMQRLDQNYIGFVSYNNSMVIMRNITSDDDMNRYDNYNIFGNTDNSMRYYCIPTICNYNSVEPPILVHIAEGPFDILSIFYNLRWCNRKQNIYIATCGKDYFGAVKFLLSDLGLMNFEVHVYPDADVRNEDLEYMYDALKRLNIGVYCHRNTLYKDMGVPRERINEIVEKIN